MGARASCPPRDPEVTQGGQDGRAPRARRYVEGDCFIKTLTRGAVRERMLFRRLAEASIELPPWSAQTEAAAKLTPVRTAAETMAQQLAAIHALPAVLLRRAFSGEL